jgi:hypothetical protein
VLAVALHQVCAAGPKRDLAQSLDENLPLVSCLRASAFTGQAFHRMAQSITERELEVAQVALAKAAVGFKLSTDVLATAADRRARPRTYDQATSSREGLRACSLGAGACLMYGHTSPPRRSEHEKCPCPCEGRASDHGFASSAPISNPEP